MSAVVEATCTCGSIGRQDLRQCQEHHHIWRGDRRLASIGSIVYASFPRDPTIPPAVLENARDRGSETDRLFAAYVRGELQAIPAGTRKDSLALFLKLQKWYDRQNFKTVEVQVLLGGEDHGGVLDFIFNGMPIDLKATAKVEHSHRIQTALYSWLIDQRAHGAILHVTERLAEPRLVPLTGEDFTDAEIILAHWRMLQRRTRS